MRNKILGYKNYKIKIGDNEVSQRVILMKKNNKIEKGKVKKHLRLIAKELGISIINPKLKNPILTTHRLGKEIYDRLKLIPNI